ncbi:hypothetical protein [Paenibacillus eucommiae]|uniref:HEAT repeat domain-containing protein n=1 Tax=Paenibacillus eucommiae TaxID=1355755 RepID=A0ABS4JA34_9BACL|nr:hypothetical protein [Paenibacillus eucommiae]MBP1996115.1 hypothetical protein [Paenibacillus eucommiae]
MNTTAGNELMRNGKEMFDKGAFGGAAFYFFGAVKTNPAQLEAWMNLFISLQQLNRQTDLQILLARYAQLGLPFAPPFAAAAATIYRNNPFALRDWIDTTRSNGVADPDSKDMFDALRADADQACAQLKEQLTAEQLEEKGMMPLLRIAAYQTPLELYAGQPDDQLLIRIEEAIHTKEYKIALEALQTLALFPLPRTERILRKCCSDEQMSTKLQTHALISLSKAGFSGKIRVAKNGKTSIIDLEKPETPLEDKLPEAFEPIMNWIAAWLARENGVIDNLSFAKLSAEPSQINAAALMEKIGEKTLPQIVMMSAGFMLKEAYLHYYPDIPYAGYQVNEWGCALLDLIQAYTKHGDIGWEYGKLPALSGTAIRRKEWLADAIPELKDVILKAAANEEN